MSTYPYGLEWPFDCDCAERGVESGRGCDSLCACYDCHTQSHSTETSAACCREFGPMQESL